jgi:hypothetical protein
MGDYHFSVPGFFTYHVLANTFVLSVYYCHENDQQKSDGLVGYRVNLRISGGGNLPSDLRKDKKG